MNRLQLWWHLRTGHECDKCRPDKKDYDKARAIIIDAKLEEKP